MAITWETLKADLRITHDEDDGLIERDFDNATVLVEGYIGENFVPEEIIELSILKTGSDLYAQRNSPQGVSQFADMDNVGIRVARDPLAACKPLLRKYVIGIK